MLNNFFNKIEQKKITIIERRPLSNEPLKKVTLKPASKITPMPDNWTVEQINNYISPYSQLNHRENINPNNDITDTKNINVPKAPNVDGVKILNWTRKENTTIEGWSGTEIAEYRKQIESSMKPETLEALKKLSVNRNKSLKTESRDSEVMSKIRAVCSEKPEQIDGDKPDRDVEMEEQSEDLSFLPISPKNSFVNMNKLEMDKLEWMRFISKSSEKNKSLSIRFHIDGSAISPDMEQEELWERPREEFDYFKESLNHHGEEPHRDGYTISELYWLARCSFSSQRSLAVLTLRNMITKSNQLQHVYRFNVPVLTSSLVDCGLIFLARWLVDEAGESQQYLHEALSLLHSVMVCDADGDRTVLNWPDSRVALATPQFMSRLASDKHKKRVELPLSERGQIQDDILMAEDLVSCLVSRTHFLDRISFLIVDRKISLLSTTDGILMEILHRIVSHSLEMANVLCHEHERLMRELVRQHVLRQSASTSAAVKLVRLLCQASPSLTHKLTRDQTIINAIYSFVTNSSTDQSILMESLHLLTVLIHQDVHAGPIGTIVPSISDHLVHLLDNCLSSPICQPMLTFLATYISATTAISPDTHAFITRCVIATKNKLLASLDAPVDYHPLLASMLHLVLTFATHQYKDKQISCFQVATDFWNDLLSILLMSPLLDSLMQQLTDASILGYEHRNPNLELFTLDLPNLFTNSTRLAVKTRNPKFIDIQPFFMQLHPSFSLLSAICHTISFMASTKLSMSSLNNSTLTPSLDRIPRVMKFISNVAHSSLDRVAPVSSYSAIVQLELECMSQLLLGVIGMAEWSHTNLDSHVATILYKATIKILPFLGSSLHMAGRELADRIIFNPLIIKSMQVAIPNEVLQLLIESLPSIRLVYETCHPTLAQSSSQEMCRLSLDDFFLPPSWTESPFVRFYQQRFNQDPDSNATKLSSHSVTNCLAFTMFLETGNIILDKMVPIDGIRILSYVFMSDDWSDDFHEPTNRLMISILLQNYLSKPAQIDISAKVSHCSSFFSLYTTLLDQYFSVSLCDSLLVNIVMFPCAMRFPVRYRKTMWKMYLDQIRLITMNISESFVPISEYLQPEEIDEDLIRHYWHVLRLDKITEEDNQVIYWTCIHHLNRFIFNQSLPESNRLLSIQRGFAHALTNQSWGNKEWIQQIRLYKHFVGSTPEFYEELPVNRVQHLSSLQADWLLKNAA